MSTKTNPGNYFEDFHVGMSIVHATPRTVTDGDVSLYTALYGSRFAVQSSSAFAKSVGLPAAPLDDMLLFHVVFGKTVPDISLNAIANLGYASGRFHALAYPGDTISTVSEVIGLKENSNGKDRDSLCAFRGQQPKGRDGPGVCALGDGAQKGFRLAGPGGGRARASEGGCGCRFDGSGRTGFLRLRHGSGREPLLLGDYEAGEKIDHVDAMTVEESDHMIATRLYQNTAKVHFNQHTEKDGRFGKRIVYGGHVISLARSFSFNGLANAFKIAAINGGRHVAPIFAGDTVYAWSEVLSKDELPGRSDLGALRLRLVGVKDQDCAAFPYKDQEGKYDPAVVLDFDYTVLIPRKG